MDEDEYNDVDSDNDGGEAFEFEVGDKSSLHHFGIGWVVSLAASDEWKIQCLLIEHVRWCIYLFIKTMQIIIIRYSQPI